MFSKFLIPSLLLGILIINTGCDSTSHPTDINGEFASIKTVTVSQNVFEFSAANDGFKDTTITISILMEANNPELVTSAGYSLYQKGSSFPALINNLSRQNNTFSTDITIETNTTAYLDYELTIFLIDENLEKSDYLTQLEFIGFSNNKPVIDDFSTPETITRPETGETPATFTAQVSDADGNGTISQVFVRIIDQETGEVNGSPFLMADDGTNLGDQTANDYIYTLSFGVTATDNRPDRDYDIEFYAIDRGGLSSDTVRTSFSIRE